MFEMIAFYLYLVNDRMVLHLSWAMSLYETDLCNESAEIQIEVIMNPHSCFYHQL